MDALDISYRLRRLGKTQSQIARELGVRQGVVSNVIHDRSTAHGVAAYIAQLLECQVEDLGPSATASSRAARRGTGARRSRWTNPSPSQIQRRPT